MSVDYGPDAGREHLIAARRRVAERMARGEPLDGDDLAQVYDDLTFVYDHGSTAARSLTAQIARVERESIERDNGKQDKWTATQVWAARLFVGSVVSGLIAAALAILFGGEPA